MKAHSIAVALGDEGWGMLDYGSLTEWPQLEDELKAFLDCAWDTQLPQECKTYIAKAGFPGDMDKLDVKQYQGSINELRILAAMAWSTSWRDQGFKLSPSQEWHEGLHWSGAIGMKLKWNMKMRAHFSKEVRKLKS